MTIKIPEPMIAAALKTLQESGAADSPLSCDALLVERMIVAALAAGTYEQHIAGIHRAAEGRPVE